MSGDKALAWRERFSTVELVNLNSLDSPTVYTWGYSKERIKELESHRGTVCPCWGRKR